MLLSDITKDRSHLHIT